MDAGEIKTGALAILEAFFGFFNAKMTVMPCRGPSCRIEWKYGRQLVIDIPTLLAKSKIDFIRKILHFIRENGADFRSPNDNYISFNA